MNASPIQILSPHHAGCHSLLPFVRHHVHACDRPQSVQCHARHDNDSCDVTLGAALNALARCRAQACEAPQHDSAVNESESLPPPCVLTACEEKHAHKAYAPPALAKVTEYRQSLPPDQQQPLRSERMMTNIGSIVDVLL